MGYELPSIKNKVYPEPEELLKILARNDKESLDERDQRQFTALAERALKINPRLYGHTLTRKTAITAFGWGLKGEDSRIADAQERLKKPIETIIENYWKLPAFGKLGFFVEWENPTGSLWLAEKIQAVALSDLDATKNAAYLWSGEQRIERAPDESFFYSVADSYLQTVMFTEVLRWDAVKEQANFIKKLKGILQIVDKGGSDEDRQNAESAATMAIKNNYLVTGEAIEFKLNQIAGQTGATFGEAIERFNSDISVGVLGQANTSELPNSGGSRAALQVQKLISADIHYSDINGLEKFINENIIYWDSIKNYGTAPAWTFRVNIEEEREFADVAAAVSELIGAGVPLLKSEVYKLLGLTEPSAGEELISG